jgi:hypothetical protein
VTAFTVSALRSRRGWELHIRRGGAYVGVTQCEYLTDAEMTARDYVETLYDRDVSGDTFTVVLDRDEDPQAEWKSRQRDAEPEAGG